MKVQGDDLLHIDVGPALASDPVSHSDLAAMGRFTKLFDEISRWSGPFFDFVVDVS